jgi:hypothetical protein
MVIVTVMPVMVDRMTRIASQSASHSSPGLPPHHRQGARCCLRLCHRLFCRRLSVCKKLHMHACMVMPVMVDRMTRNASQSASHSLPGLPPRQRPRQRARCFFAAGSACAETVHVGLYGDTCDGG